MSPAYFFYDMSLEECEAFIRGRNESKRDSWEQTRMLGYLIAQVNSSKHLKPSDIMTFPWDNEKKEAKPDMPTEDELAELRAEAAEWSKILKERDNGKEQ